MSTTENLFSKVSWTLPSSFGPGGPPEDAEVLPDLPPDLPPEPPISAGNPGGMPPTPEPVVLFGVNSTEVSLWVPLIGSGFEGILGFGPSLAASVVSCSDTISADDLSVTAEVSPLIYGSTVEEVSELPDFPPDELLDFLPDLPFDLPPDDPPSLPPPDDPLDLPSAALPDFPPEEELDLPSAEEPDFPFAEELDLPLAASNYSSD